ncbi:hypothetical protein [Enterococcus hirae]|uniref:hypothetical protein n=1 Tax=Enterococcus hirae TaxID=1354 RepID=UPI001F1D6434|nr:hypothetical protein [Enterococcus hirae]
MKEKSCSCEICRQKKCLEKIYPDKILGMQYAYWEMIEGVNLLISAEELEFLEGEGTRINLTSEQSEKILTIAYGIFDSQCGWYDCFYELEMNKGTAYYYFDLKRMILIPVCFKDYFVLEQEGNQAKVAVLISSSESLPFPKNQSELSLTFTKLITGLGKHLDELIFSRLEYGIFRLDYGELIRTKHDWKKQIKREKIFSIYYRRFLFVDE